LNRRARQWCLFASVALVGCSAGSTIREAMVHERHGYVDAGSGVRLGFRKVGSGPETIVVLHGGPGFTFDYLADDLLPLAKRHTVVFYDQRGAGRSTLVGGAEALDARRFAEDLEAVRSHFGLQKLTLLAHSWGAAVAALYALRFPEHVERLILVGAVPPRRAELDRAFGRLRTETSEEWRNEVKRRGAAWRADPGNAAACRAFNRTWFEPFFVDAAALTRSKGDFCAGTPDSLKNRIENVDRFVVASLGDFDWRAPLRAVEAPALIIHGAADPLPVEGAREWAGALPQGRMLLIDGVGHFPYLEAPEQFFAAVEQFVRGEWPQGARRP
jgi:proline iminopeptidase